MDNQGYGRALDGTTNSNSISIEICVNKDSDYDVAVANAIELTKNLMARFNIKASEVRRHYDVSRKQCPGTMKANNWAKWNEFKKKIQEPMILKIDTSKNYSEATMVQDIKPPLENNTELRTQAIKLSIDGKIQTLNGYNVNDMNYLPARELLESLGYTVGWSDNMITADKNTVPSKPKLDKFYRKNNLEIIETTIDNLIFELANGKTLRQLDVVGINGPVFDTARPTPASSLWAIGIVNGKLLGPNADNNDGSGKKRKRATMICINNHVTVEYIWHINESVAVQKAGGIQYIQWAIGGFGNLTLPWLELDFEQIPAGDRNPTNRTAIAAKDKTIYLITGKSMTYQQLHKNVRLAIPDYQGAIALDGGGSSQLRWIDNSGLSSNRGLNTVLRLREIRA